MSAHPCALVNAVQRLRSAPVLGITKTVSVPASTAARVAAEATLGRVDVGDGFAKKEGVFLTEPALSGGGPVLKIRAGVRLGSLQLRTA